MCVLNQSNRTVTRYGQWWQFGYMKLNMRAYQVASVLPDSLETPWILVHQAPLSMGFPRQEYWSGLPCPPPGDFPDPGIELTSLTYPALVGGFFTTPTTWETRSQIYWKSNHFFLSNRMSWSLKKKNKNCPAYRQLFIGPAFSACSVSGDGPLCSQPFGLSETAEAQHLPSVTMPGGGGGG